MERLKIALLAGGDSSEREIALNSAHQISEALDAEKYDVKVIDLHHRSWSYTAANGAKYEVDKNDFSLTVEGERTEFDYALIIIHGTPGEDGKLQGYLDMMGIPYSSCSQVSSTITFDKVSTKRAVAERGINVAKEVFLHKGEPYSAEAIAEELGLPLFVKPNASGSSFGVTRVTEIEQIEEVIRNRQEGFLVLSGDDGMAVDVMRRGGDGVISVAANLFPQQFGECIKLATKGEFEKADEAYAPYDEVVQALFAEGNPTGIKCALKAKGLIGGTMRLPLVEGSQPLFEKFVKFIEIYDLH